MCLSEGKSLKDEDVLQHLPVGTTATFYFRDLGSQISWVTVSTVQQRDVQTWGHVVLLQSHTVPGPHSSDCKYDQAGLHQDIGAKDGGCSEDVRCSYRSISTGEAEGNQVEDIVFILLTASQYTNKMTTEACLSYWDWVSGMKGEDHGTGFNSAD